MKKQPNDRRVTGSYRMVGDKQTRPTVPEMRRVRPPLPEAREPEPHPTKV